MENHRKIRFPLEPDSDGYPPVGAESLWAYECEPGLYSVDNIPFYVKGISSGDIVAADVYDGMLEFQQLVRPSENSVFRLILQNVTDVQKARDSFRQLGCSTELSNIPGLFSLEIPGSVPFEPVAALLDAGLESGRWEYEEGVLRHPIPQSPPNKNGSNLEIPNRSRSFP